MADKVNIPDEVEYIYAHVTEEGEVFPHYSGAQYFDIESAKRDRDRIVKNIPDFLQEDAILCKMTTSYEIVGE